MPEARERLGGYSRAILGARVRWSSSRRCANPAVLPGPISPVVEVRRVPACGKAAVAFRARAAGEPQQVVAGLVVGRAALALEAGEVMVCVGIDDVQLDGDAVAENAGAEAEAAAPDREVREPLAGSGVAALDYAASLAQH